MLIYSPGGHGSTVIIRGSRKPGTVKTARESCHSEHVGGGGGGGVGTRAAILRKICSVFSFKSFFSIEISVCLFESLFD